MAEQYKMTFSIKVTKGDANEPVIEESSFLEKQSFQGMVNLADYYYDFIAKVKGVK